MTEEKVQKADQPVVAAPASYEDDYFELQPIEKKLISYSLLLGIVLLIVFIFAFEIF